MSSTVITSILDSVSNASTGLSLMAILALLVVLILKEVVSVSDRPGLQALSRALNVAIAPLLLAFLLIAAIRIIEELQ
jgi:hypothetical protein